MVCIAAARTLARSPHRWRAAVRLWGLTARRDRADKSGRAVDALLATSARFRSDQHATQDRWLAHTFDQAHRSPDRSRRVTNCSKTGVLRYRTPLKKRISGLPKGSS